MVLWINLFMTHAAVIVLLIYIYMLLKENKASKDDKVSFYICFGLIALQIVNLVNDMINLILC